MNIKVACRVLFHDDMEILSVKVSEVLLNTNDWKMIVMSRHVMTKNKDEGEKGTFDKLTITEEEL